MSTLRFSLAATALSLVLAGGAYAQQTAPAQSAQTAGPASSAPAPFDIPAECRASAQAGGQGQMMHGSGMTMQNAPMMQNMQGMMGSLSEAQKASMEAMMKMNPAMMQGMMAKDPDVAWACSMIPHHLGAIEMAKAVIKNGHDAEIRKMAEKTIKEQEKEVSELKDWLQKHAKK